MNIIACFQDLGDTYREIETDFLKKEKEKLPPSAMNAWLSETIVNRIHFHIKLFE